MGEGTTLCHHFIFVIKNENTDIQNINRVLFSGRLQYIYFAGEFTKLNEKTKIKHYID